jgi:hypothetical protein
MEGIGIGFSEKLSQKEIILNQNSPNKSSFSSGY